MQKQAMVAQQNMQSQQLAAQVAMQKIQAQTQSELEAQKQLAFQQAYQPLQAAQQYGAGVMGLISGYPGKETTQVTPSPTPLQTALGTASTLAGIYRLMNPQPISLFGQPRG